MRFVAVFAIALLTTQPASSVEADELRASAARSSAATEPAVMGGTSRPGGSSSAPLVIESDNKVGVGANSPDVNIPVEKRLDPPPVARPAR